MAKKKKSDDAPPGAPAWMTTYGDLMTLLLCFFVLLFGFSTLDADKLKEFSSHFSISGEPAIIVFQGSTGITGLLGNGILEFPDQVESSATKNEADQSKEDLIEGYTQELKNTYPEGYETYFATGETIGGPHPQGIQIDIQDQTMKIDIPGDFLFDSGSAEIKQDFQEALLIIAQIILEQYLPGSVIKVEGHTDNIPMNNSSSRFRDNWELSSGRAISVINALIPLTDLDGSCFEAVARSEYHPVSENDTPEGRQKNRRVVLYIERVIKAE